MSKLQERLPALATREDRLELTASVLDEVTKNGRIEKSALVEAISERLSDEEINQEVVVREAKRGISEQLASAWANQATIKLDRSQRVPVYQLSIGFKDSWFKVGSTFVKPEAMTAQDFEVMLERLDHRIENATTDRSILATFYDRAKPGLEAGQNLLQQFEAGTLELESVNGKPALEEGEVAAA